MTSLNLAKFFLHKSCIIFLSLLFFFSSYNILRAQTDEEFEILNLYYTEKDLVVISATRHPKSISQVAENITVITKKDIENIHAHTLAEILQRIPGIYIQSNRDFGGHSQLDIQGSDSRHVLVLIDGISWNLMANGSALTQSIPVGIIKRIEIIKGTASSSWGSSLGGVINIITKSENSKKPACMIHGSYGEGNSQDYRCQLSGRSNKLGYFLFTDNKESDGLLNNRFIDAHSFYGKLNFSISAQIDLNISLGYSTPKTDFDTLQYGENTFRLSNLLRNSFATSSIQYTPNRSFQLDISLYHFEQIFEQIFEQTNELNEAETSLSGIFDNIRLAEKNSGIRAKCNWTNDLHTAVFGIDLDQGEMNQSYKNTNPDRLKWAVYFNDTIEINNWTFIPGMRLDHDATKDSFFSPSFGITFNINKNTIFRTSIARGFNTPPFSWLSRGGLQLEPNPFLDHESIWSYQAGIESNYLKYIWLKASFFRYEIKDTLVIHAMDEANTRFKPFNSGKNDRQGLEIELETRKYNHLSISSGFSCVDSRGSVIDELTFERYSAMGGIKYEDHDTAIFAEFYCQYVWWDISSRKNAAYKDPICEFNISKKILYDQVSAEIFLNIHNIFNQLHYIDIKNINPPRWVEAGLIMRF